MKEGTYFTVQSWMVTDLELKGNELMVFAIIYGFSQDNTSKFIGSINYLTKWVNVSRTTIIEVLKKLVDKGYLIKEQEIKNNITWNKYRAVSYRGSKESVLPIQKLDGGSKESVRGGSKESVHNNIIDYNINDNKKEIIIKKNFGNLIDNNSKLKRTITSKNSKIQKSQFEIFWKLYPKKIDKGKCLAIWNRICTRQDNVPNWLEIRKAIHSQKNSERWKDPKFIKHPSTWLNNFGWLDNASEMKSYNFEQNNSSKSKLLRSGLPANPTDNFDNYLVPSAYSGVKKIM